jgi:glycine dehydrogenase subunit 2
VSGPKGIARGGLAFEEKLLFELARPGRVGYDLPRSFAGAEEDLSDLEGLCRDDIPGFPELSEPEVMRHFVRLSQWNYGIDSGLYPLGSCTMKYNPKINEEVARWPGFALVHPAQPDSEVQGLLRLMWELQGWLGEISGMDAVSLQPAAGAHGELTALLMARAYFHDQGRHPSTVLIPDTAHGTNPSSAQLAGYRVREIPSGPDGVLEVEQLAPFIDDDVAVLMVTNPNTLGLFERDIGSIASLLHDKGALLYMDGANLNAVMGVTRPGDQGADMMHFNLHKTFTTPHGGGGPGAGPVGVKRSLEPYLPRPQIVRDGERYRRDLDRPRSIGRVRSWQGNVGMLVRAYAYILEMGGNGLHAASRRAVMNANYLLAALRDLLDLPYGDRCMHEVVFSDRSLAESGCSTMDIAKRLIDHGFHPPTVYFPLVVHGAMMMEPTETVSKETLDEYVEAMRSVVAEAHEHPEVLKEAPYSTVRRRLDEVRAARQPVLRWRPEETEEG